MKALKVGIRVAALCMPLLTWGMSGNDGVTLTMTRVLPPNGQIVISWDGGTGPYTVLRSTIVSDVESPASFVATSSASPYTDTPPPGQTFYYFIKPTCLPDSNPVCTNYVNLGSIWGDLGSGSAYWSGTAEQWLRLNLVESSSGDYDLSAMFFLYSPPGSDFDLYIRCSGCSGGANSVSQIHSLTGHTDTAFTLRHDTERIDTYPVIIEVRAYDQTSCGTWQLTVVGNTGGEYETCANP
jgi:hypothetical protein